MNKTNAASIEELYIKEKKKSNILLASTVILAILFVGSLVNGSSSNPSDTALQDIQNARQQGGGPGGRGGQVITGFFDENGAVDQAAVDTLAERFTQGGGPPGADPSQFLERFMLQIDAAVESGEITQAQGDQLQAAFNQTETSEI